MHFDQQDFNAKMPVLKKVSHGISISYRYFCIYSQANFLSTQYCVFNANIHLKHALIVTICDATKYQLLH